jgi:membrane protease YdiL (CAAX protease family)
MSAMPKEWVRNHAVAVYFLLTFAISWASWFAVFLLPLPRPWRAVLNQAGLAGPLLASLVIVAALHGARGLGRFLGRVFQWRAGVQWYLFVLFGAAALGLAAIGMNALGGGKGPSAGFALAPGALLSGLREEHGWRGFALPRLQERYGAAKAAILVGVMWALWHLPILPFPRMGLPGVGMTAMFVLEVVALSVLMTWVYNHTRGGLLLPVLYHAAYNLTLAGLGIPGAVPLWGAYLLLTWGLVIVIVARCGAARLSRGPLPLAGAQ